MWRDDIRNVNVVYATEEGRSNDHQYKHESIKKKATLWFALSREDIGVFPCKQKSPLPHHVINHLSDGDLQSSQGLVGW